VSQFSKIVRFLFIASALFLSACISVSDFKNTVMTKLGDDVFIERKLDTGNVVIKTEKRHFLDSAVVVDKQASYFIPAIVFWGKENTLGCNINNRYFVNLFSDVFRSTADELLLRKNLVSRRLEIDMETVPSNFVYTDKFFLMFVFVAYSYSYTEAIYPVEQKIKISYRILDGDKEVKSGQYTGIVAQPMNNGLKSHGKFVGDYLDKLKSNFEQQSEKAILQIADDLY
jgi:hypothetical protein